MRVNLFEPFTITFLGTEEENYPVSSIGHPSHHPVPFLTLVFVPALTCMDTLTRNLVVSLLFVFSQWGAPADQRVKRVRPGCIFLQELSYKLV
jgi:hypothetical protein